MRSDPHAEELSMPPSEHITPAPLRLALGEYDIGWHDPEASLRRAARLVERAAAGGAELMVLPEMCATGFTMEPERYAEPVDGPSATRLAELACAHRIHLLAGLAIREEADGTPEYYNAALLLGPDGERLGEYRKQRLYAHAGEDRPYRPGSGHRVFDVRGVRIAPLICYDLRFPELFRAAGPEVDALMVLANWPVARRFHWDVLVRARAIENQCYVAAVNRTGSGGGLEYDGGSAAYDPMGRRLDSAREVGSSPAMVEIDPAEVTRVRSELPFTVDRRWEVPV
jgi:omega-amidase